MTNQNDLSELKTFADWCRAIDRLPAEAKRIVEALVELVDWGYVWSWIPDAVKTALECEIRERTFSACTELGLGEYYDEFPLKDVWSLIPDEVRIAIKERILLACKKLSFQKLPRWDSSYQLTDLCPLASFTQLTSLDLNGVFDIDFGRSRSYGKLSDISIIANFTHLTELDLGQNSITDLSPLAALTELKVLDLSDNLITDLSPLSTLKNLTDLNLDGSRLTEETDFSPLLALTQLQSLDLSRNWIDDRSVETIARLTTLKNLDVSYNRITDISPLTTLPNLIHLNSRCAWDSDKGGCGWDL